MKALGKVATDFCLCFVFRQWLTYYAVQVAQGFLLVCFLSARGWVCALVHAAMSCLFSVRNVEICTLNVCDPLGQAWVQ